MRSAILPKPKKSQKSRLEELFKELQNVQVSEDSPEGYFTRSDLQHFMQNARVKRKLFKVGIRIDDPETLFRLLAKSEEGNALVDMQSFVSGCERLTGKGHCERSTPLEYQDSFADKEFRMLASEFEADKDKASETAETSGISIHWSPRRRALAKVMLSPRFDFFISFVIIVNTGIILFETDQNALCYPEFKDAMSSCPTASENKIWLGVANNAFLVTYTIEAILSMYVLRLKYFTTGPNLFDLLVCTFGWVALMLQSIMDVSWLRVLRTGRILKTLKFVYEIRELYMLVSGFVGAMKALFYGALIILAMLVFFSILIVQLVHPFNSEIIYEGCERCPRGFRSISQSVLTLFQQIIAGDSWGLISVPVIEEKPVFGLLLPLSVLVIGVGAMNLILAVVVDCAVEARATNEAKKVKDQAANQLSLKKELLEVVRELDRNKDGQLDIGEVMDAAVNNKKFQFKLRLVGLTPDELYEIMLAIGDAQGRITYVQFCNFIYELHETNSIYKKNLGLFNKMHIKHLRKEMLDKFDSQEKVLLKIEKQIKESLGRQISGPSADRQISPLSGEEQPPCHNVSASGTGLPLENIKDVCAAASKTKNHIGDLAVETEVSNRSKSQDVDAMKDRTQPSLGSLALSNLLQSFEASMNIEIGHLRKSQAEIDRSWSRLLGIFHLALEQCSDVEAGNPNELLKGNPCKPLCKHVAEQFAHTLQNSISRRSKFFNDIMYDVGEDLVSMLRQCRALAVPKSCDGEPSLKRPTDLRVL